MQRTRKFVALMAAVLLAMSAGAGQAMANTERGVGVDRPDRSRADEALAERADREGPLQLIVEIDRPGRGQSVADEARRRGGTGLRTYSHMPYVALRGTGKTIRALERNPHVQGIWEDVPVPPALDSSSPVINADDTRDLGWTGEGQTVAILDTGIDADHPFFDDNNGSGDTRIVSQACYSDLNNTGDTDGDGVDDDQEFSLCGNGGTSDTSSDAADVDGHPQCTVALCDHGTHVAGIAAGDGTGLAGGAPAAGVAPDAGIIAIQVFTRFNQGTDCSPAAAPCVLSYTADQIAGLNQVVALDTANPGWNITAANMSLGGGNNSTACDGDSRKAAIDTLLAAGVATTIASGNSGFLNAVGAPACISSAVTVGNSTNGDAVWTSSNRGPLVDIFAPGRSINSSITDDTYGTKTGTSMAAPQVAGAFAVLAEAYPSRSIGDLLSDMQTSGVPLTYATNSTGTTSQTTPRLDLLAALQVPNDPPGVTVDDAVVTVDEGQPAANAGTYNDPEGDAIISGEASAGTLTFSGGNWSWDFEAADGPTDSQTVDVSFTDDKQETTTVSFDLVVDNVAPTVSIDASAPASVDEGQIVDLDAAFSDPGWEDTYSSTIDWGDGTTDTVTPGTTTAGSFGSPHEGTVQGSHAYADNGVYTITVTVTDDDTESDTAQHNVTVGNVDPTVTLTSPAAVSIDENTGTVDVSASFSDPGWGDTHSATVSWDVAGESPQSAPVTITNTGGSGDPATGTVSASRTYGDNGVYTVTVTVTDDDGGFDSASATVTVDNVNPEVTIDATDAVDFSGVPTLLADAGEAVDVSARMTDPGSDDLMIAWDWGDGSSNDTATYLVDPPGDDPTPSPSIDPRDVTDSRNHTFSGACLYTVTATATDDDGGTDDDTIQVAIRGLADEVEGNGYWYTQYRFDGQRNANDVSDDTLGCYLALTNSASTVFAEERALDNLDDAKNALNTKKSKAMSDIFDAQLLTAWLNWSSGAYDFDTMVDSDGDGVVDSTFGDVIVAAEAVRVAHAAGTATDTDLEDQKNILERLNLRDE